jgi:Glycosyltransferase like family
MIAFGSYIVDPEAYRRYAEPGIRLAMEPDSEVVTFAHTGSPSRSSNLLIDHVAGRDDLEALVLVHPHTEIVDPDLCSKVRSRLADPEVAVVGCAGATGVKNLAWWEGEMVCGLVTLRYPEHGSGEVPAFIWAQHGSPPAEVDAVDGMLLVLSPWAVRNLRFDESLSDGFGFDLDFCFEARAAERKVVVAEFCVVYHRSVEVLSDPQLWVHAHMQLAEKWESRWGAGDVDWMTRARRAEAEREAARAVAQATLLGSDARVLELEREIEEKTGSLSWRITAPLRRANHLRRALLTGGRART